MRLSLEADMFQFLIGSMRLYIYFNSAVEKKVSITYRFNDTKYVV